MGFIVSCPVERVKDSRKESAKNEIIADVTGSLCENNDKFAIDRALPKIEIGDIAVIHDGGAHGYAMGTQLLCCRIEYVNDGGKEMNTDASLEGFLTVKDFAELVGMPVSAILKALLPSLSNETPMMRPGIERL